MHYSRSLRLFTPLLLLGLTSCAQLQQLVVPKPVVQERVLFDPTHPLAENLQAYTSTPALIQWMGAHAAALDSVGYRAVTTLHNGEVIVVEMGAEQLFLPNDTVVSTQGIAQLHPITTLLTHHPHLLNVAVVVHADDTGSENYLKQLTHARATAVAQQLDSTSVATYGVGSTEPIRPNNSVENRRENRRIMIYLVPSNYREGAQF